MKDFHKFYKAEYLSGAKDAHKESVDEDTTEMNESSFTQKEIKMAIGIARDKRYAGGNYTGAVNAIEKIKKGLSKHPRVAEVLKKANESVSESTATLSAGERAIYKKIKSVAKTSPKKALDLVQKHQNDLPPSVWDELDAEISRYMREESIDEVKRDPQDASYTDRYSTGGKDTPEMQKRRMDLHKKSLAYRKKHGKFPSDPYSAAKKNKVDLKFESVDEETQNIDELSRKTLGSYISKASDARKHRNLPTKKVDNRYSGVALASKKYDKKERNEGVYAKIAAAAKKEAQKLASAAKTDGDEWMARQMSKYAAAAAKGSRLDMRNSLLAGDPKDRKMIYNLTLKVFGGNHENVKKFMRDLGGKNESVSEAKAPGATAQHGPNDETSDSFKKQVGGGRTPREKEFLDMHQAEVGLDAEAEYRKNQEEVTNSLKRAPQRLGDKRDGDTSFVNPIKAEIIDGITKALEQMKTNK